MSNDIVQYGVGDIRTMAEAFAKSKLFGIQTPEQAMALCWIAQAEGCHPAIAMRDYQLIQGKPSLKADAMLARFQGAGGRVEWKELCDERVEAVFTHELGGSAKIDWDKDRAITAGLWGKENWKKYPRAMLRARVISEGVRTVFPAVNNGFYTPEEVQDFDEPEKKPFTGTTIEQPQEKPIPVIVIPREQQEKVYDECLAKLNGAVDVRALQEIWGAYSGKVKTLDEDLRVDLVQKKDEAKEELLQIVTGLEKSEGVTS